MNLNELRADAPLHLRGVKVRFAILGFLLVLAVAVAPLSPLESFLPIVLVIISAAMCANFVSFVWIIWGKGVRYRVYFAAFMDLALVTLAVHYVGGIETPAVWVYAVVVIAYSSLYGLRVGVYTAALSTALYTGLLYAEFMGAIEHVSRGFLNPAYIHRDASYLRIKLLCDNFLFFVSALVAGRLSEKLIFGKIELQRMNEQLRREIAERRRAEKARHESGVKYRTLVEQSLQGLVVVQDYQIVFANRAMSGITGFTVDELLGLTPEKVQALVHPDDRDVMWQRLRQRLEGKDVPPHYEFRAFKKDGTVVWLEMLATRIDYKGRPAVQTLFMDITERRRVEQALRESEERYRLHFEHVNDCIFSLDSESRITTVSPSLETLFGYKPDEILGRPLSELTIVASEYYEKAVEDVGRVFAGERIAATEYEFITKTGKRKTVSVSGAPLFKNGEVVAVVSVARDITEQKQLERQLMQAQKMESIGTLAGGIAHDFNNLLGGILGYASFMKAKVARDHEFFKYLDTVERSASRAAELTGQLLAFARGGKYEVRVIDLSGVVKEALAIIERTIDKSIEIETHFSERLPTVEADPVQMEQIILNLCLNARDAMPDGGRLIVETHAVHLSQDYVRTHVEAEPGPYVVLSVTDTGVGMESETMQRIFEPFFTTKKEGEGTGLGLSMVYGVVKNHGGYMCVYSEPGEGATFKVYLPVNGKAEGLVSPEHKTPPGGEELILVVDDEESIRRLAKDILEGHGYRVLLAEDGVEAVRIYKERGREISLAILDMIMPRMGGRETFLKLKELDSQVRILLSTGYSQNGKAKEILDNGVAGFIQKPYQFNALLTKVRHALDIA